MKFSYVFLFAIVHFSCTHDAAKKQDTITFTSDSQKAIDWYAQGWKEIMDNGQYAAAEQSYRKALESDPNFLMAKSVLGRLTLDTDERLKIYKDLQKNKEALNGDERRLFDVYTAFVHFTNQRELAPEKAKETLDSTLIIAEKNLNHIVHSYPQELYLKAEYIEILHSLYGPQRALDSLKVLADNNQKETPFLLGYTATLHAELGEFNLALRKAHRLAELQNDTTLPKSHTVFANVYLAMDSLEIAKKYAEKATRLDGRNLDASRLLDKIDERLTKLSKK